MLGTENQHKPDVFLIVWRFNVGGLNSLKAWLCSVMIYDGYCPHARNWTGTCQKWVPGSLNKCMLSLSGKTAQIPRPLDGNTTSMTMSWVFFIDPIRLHTITSTYLCSSHRIHPNSSTLCALRRASLMCLATSAVVLKWYRQYHHWNQNNNHSSGLASKTEATGRSLAQIKVFHQRFATSFVPLKKIDASVTGLAPPQLLEDPSAPSGLYHI